MLRQFLDLSSTLMSSPMAPATSHLVEDHIIMDGQSMYACLVVITFNFVLFPLSSVFRDQYRCSGTLAPHFRIYPVSTPSLKYCCVLRLRFSSTTMLSFSDKVDLHIRLHQFTHLTIYTDETCGRGKETQVRPIAYFIQSPALTHGGSHWRFLIAWFFKLPFHSLWLPYFLESILYTHRHDSFPQWQIDIMQSHLC